jgi:hypothetical protein
LLFASCIVFYVMIHDLFPLYFERINYGEQFS